MADWKDFLEDGKEIRGQLLDALEQRHNRTQKPVKVPPPVRFCPVCDKPFLEEVALLNHVRSVHGPQHIYLRLNGSVIRDIGWAANGVSELIVVPISLTEISVELNANNFTQKIRAARGTDLLPYVPKAFEGELTIDVSAGSSVKSRFVVYARSLPEFRHDALDSLIMSLSTEALAATEMPDVNSWRRLNKLNDLEMRYVNGFFEYVLAFHLEASGKRKTAKYHFDESLGLLLPFRTPLAKSAQCVLGLRMNCFGILRHAPRSSVLAFCDRFFNCSSAGHQGPTITSDSNPFITYADQFTILLVKSIANYCNGEYAQCESSLHALEFHPSAQERNNEDKLLLLSARLHNRLDKHEAAFQAYSNLQFHPDFGREAKEFISGAA